jgi:hypothetical protein
VTHSTRWNKQLGDRDYDGFVTFDRAGGFKYARPFEGVPTSLASPQYEKCVGMSSDIMVRNLKGVADFHVQFARQRILNFTAGSYCSGRTFCNGVRVHVMRRATDKDDDQNHRKDDNQENDCNPSGGRSLLFSSIGLD